MDRELNNRTIGYIVYTDKSLREKEESEVYGKEGFSLGTTAYVPHRRVACKSPVPRSYILSAQISPDTTFLLELIGVG